MAQHLQASLHAAESAVAAGMADLRENRIVERIWAHDYTVWKPAPTEITNRLGWLRIMETMQPAVDEMNAFANEVRQAGFTHAVLLGMGGSSLAPEVFAKTFGIKAGFLDVLVLDSTDPGAVLALSDRLEPAKTLFVVSTKSGGTVETFSFFKYFYNWVADRLGQAQTGQHFVAITDPGSGLADTASQYAFRKTLINDPNIGGRYSALSYFGLLPAALAGIDVALLLDRAATAASTCRARGADGGDAATTLGAIMGVMALQGRDKVTLILSPKISCFGAWAEQLIAESTGKEGVGILPVDGEIVLAPEEYGADRLFVYMRVKGDGRYDRVVAALNAGGLPLVQIDLADLYDLGREIFAWEFATAVAGYFVRINPFDQPNVESAKVVARAMLAAYQKEGRLPTLSAGLADDGITVVGEVAQQATSARDALRLFLEQADAGDETGAGRSYVSLHAYVTPDAATDAALQSLRTAIQRRTRLATTVGYGPRFLHSTGQLHKGDANHGLFVQFTHSHARDAAIPDTAGAPASSVSFGVLVDAQSLGDRQALLDNQRRVIRFDLGVDVVGGLELLASALE